MQCTLATHFWGLFGVCQHLTILQSLGLPQHNLNSAARVSQAAQQLLKPFVDFDSFGGMWQILVAAAALGTKVVSDGLKELSKLGIAACQVGHSSAYKAAIFVPALFAAYCVKECLLQKWQMESKLAMKQEDMKLHERTIQQMERTMQQMESKLAEEMKLKQTMQEEFLRSELLKKKENTKLRCSCFVFLFACWGSCFPVHFRDLPFAWIGLSRGSHS